MGLPDAELVLPTINTAQEMAPEAVPLMPLMEQPLMDQPLMEQEEILQGGGHEYTD